MDRDQILDTTLSRPRTVALPTLVANLLLLTACNGARSDVPPPPTRAGTSITAPAGMTGTVATVASAEGRTVAELALGGSRTTEPGTFFRVLTADGGRVKGMLQTTEVPGPGRAVARVIALTDRSDPPAPGDVVRELTELADPGAATEKASRAEAAAGATADQAEEARFTALRSQYQRLIAEAITRHDADLAQVRITADARLAEQAEANRRDLAEREHLHAVELAAARAAGGEQALVAATGERQAAERRARDAHTERDNLRVQVDALLTAQDELKHRVERLVAERAEADRTAAARLRAEGEAREQLAARLSAAERQAGGAASAAAALLTRAPGRDEGILERLDRLSAETTVAIDRANRAEAAASDAQQALLNLRRRLADAEAARDAAETRLASAGAVDGQLHKATEDLRIARGELASVRERMSAAELARLEGERSLFDLSARVLRLPKAGADLAALQERLRALLAAHDAVAPADATAPERQP